VQPLRHSVDAGLGEHYSRIPKADIYSNIEYRRVLNKLAMRSWENRERLMGMCWTDMLFFINSFCWLFEPRTECALPFLTYDFQDDAFTTMRNCVGKRDVVLKKSRDLGATWMVLTLFFYQWMTRKRSVYGVVSRNEAMVDKAGDDPDTLFWKLDFLHDHLPPWLQVPKRHFDRVKLTMANTQTGSGIFGASATGDVARGGRKLAFMLDELASFKFADGYAAWASTQFVSNCRIAPSTPQGATGIFYDLNHSKQIDIEKIRLHWSQHPVRKIGMYRWQPEKVIEHLDRGYIHAVNYDFKQDGKLRSPYYDAECRRHPQPAKIAQELDIDFLESGFPFFDDRILQKHIDQHSRPHYSRHMFSAEGMACEPQSVPHAHGQLFLWCNLVNGEPGHDHDYTMGCDISTGRGGDESTNSVASVMDELTREKVAEFATNNQEPHEFARTVCALRQWFRGPSGPAHLVPEANGPGQGFLKTMLALMPTRIYMRVNVDQRVSKKGKVPGWWSGKKEKRVLLETYQAALAESTFINRSRLAVAECRNYVYIDGDTIEHNRAVDSMDPTSAKANHGDRVIADALAAYATLKRMKTGKPDMEQRPVKAPMYSMAWRIEDDRKAEREELVWE
jgi:hypothetical protein